MSVSFSSPIVVDTNVVFEGLTQKGGASGLVIDAWLAELLDVRISNALAYEYEDVLSRKLSSARWHSVQSVLGDLLGKATFTVIYYSWRPASPDPGDDLVIDCAMNAGATIVTCNVRDFQKASAFLGLQVLRPVEFVNTLVS
jgi:predicted nucleic acid-binding protein